MKCSHLLCWAFLLLASGPLLAHPITESAEMPYQGASEDQGIDTLGHLSLSEQTFPLHEGAGLRYSTFISGEKLPDGLVHIKATLAGNCVHIWVLCVFSVLSRPFFFPRLALWWSAGY
uniref:Uncharacterized protein n=1 Tax=Nothobranchius furzeri TaxID=105023 RepID=A0A8C6VXY8_NOTFU